MLFRTPFSGRLCLVAGLVLAYVTIARAPVAKAADEGRELLASALAHAGDTKIVTGEFRYKMALTTSLPTDEMIARRIEEIRNGLRADLDKVDNDDLRRRYQKAIDTADEYVPAQMIHNASKTTNYYFVLGGPKLGSDRYVEFSSANWKTGRREPASVVVQRFLGAGASTSLFLKGELGEALATRRSMFPRTQEPQRLGRLTGYLAELGTPHGRDTANTFDDSVGSVEASVPQGSESGDIRELVCKLKGARSGISTVKFQVDPSRGYITPLVQELGSSGNLLREWVSSDYFQPKGSDLWFPKVCVFREWPIQFGADQPRVERYEFSPDGVALNVPIPPERFAVTLNPGRVIADARDSDGSNANFIAQREVQISLDDLDRLSEMEAFKLVVPKTAPERASPLSYWLIATNVLFVCALLVWVMRRRRSQLAAALSLMLAAASLSGCERVVARSAPSSAAPLRVVPAQIELGEIAADGRTVDTSVRVENGDSQPVQVQVHASCGCTTLDSDRFLLAPGQHRDVALMLHTRGRSGESRASLRIVASPADSEAMLQEVLVPINARFHDAWRCQPNRVYLAVDASGAADGRCSVAGPADTWSEIQLDAGDSGIVVTVSSSETDGLIETRNLQVSAQGVRDGNYALSLRRGDQQQPFLVIPLLVRSGQWLSDNATPQPGFDQTP